MTIDKEIVQKRTQEILSFVRELETLSTISKQDFLTNTERQYAVMHVLQLTIEACLSLANHIVARESLGIPNNYQESFALLGKARILPDAFTEEMKKIARFRNKLVHIYWEIDLDMIYDIITTKKDDFKQFVQYISERFL
ncbi:MAG: hypothetical protein COS89_08925 [Deltaproteobacteria bacterium CG07_land_8_20_14_0_80_38_7]|nr:MAG: hypothetical protein COS89_08925 [Deltaproteobacteria bacterium CG07_land_8_20_14_0_80_38_7]